VGLYTVTAFAVISGVVKETVNAATETEMYLFRIHVYVFISVVDLGFTDEWCGLTLS
jgi:hypothetical protein